MKHSFDTLAALLDHGFDTLIDARSPAEYAEDHIPGAINLPALSNAQRAEVGTLYKQVAPFDARKLGAALIARNVAAHLQGPLVAHDGAWRPLVYCWRGGQRSGSFATILAQIGWRTGVVDGGYMTWRRLVHRALYEEAMQAPVVLLDGLTGTAKTDILNRLPGLGAQVIDLEGIANHRGSLLGAQAGGQPSQKAFESQLAVQMARLDPAQPVVIEAESNKIGDLHIPPSLWDAMKSAPELVIDAPLDARARYLTRAYGDMVIDPMALRARMAGLRALRGADIHTKWLDLLQRGAFEDLARAMMEQHYDPAYRKSAADRDRPVLSRFRSNALEPQDLDALALRVRHAITQR